MEKAAKQIPTTGEIIVSPEEGVDEVKEEIKKVPSMPCAEVPYAEFLSWS